MAITKISLFLILFSVSVSSSPTIAPSSDEVVMSLEYEKWVKDNNRIYADDEEKQNRFEIFQTNQQYVDSFNKVEGQKYQVSLNKFADLTQEEFLAKFTGVSKPSPDLSNTISSKFENAINVPDSLDWRALGAVTPVKFQGQCGSCWAFSAASSLESLVFIKTGVLTSLSEQEIMDCDGVPDGCNGGRPEVAFQFAARNRGLNSDASYPYEANESVCRVDQTPLPVPITGFGVVPPQNETAMLMAVASQPISISVDPTNFQFYTSGVFTGPCGTNLSHSVSAVGYGVTEDGVKFWLLKNSWGENWGENGYIRLLRDSGVPEGTCGLALDLTYPTV